MSSMRKLKPDREEKPPKKPDGILRKRATSVDVDRNRSRSASPGVLRSTTPHSRTASPTRQRPPSPSPVSPPRAPSPIGKGSPMTETRRRPGYLSYERSDDLDLVSSERFANQLMEIEERFNREMEQSRRRDLEKKHDLRERQLEGRIRVLEEMLSTSNEKATVLVRLMNERERQLEEFFAEQLDRVKRGSKTVRMEDDRQELLQLRALVSTLRVENDQLREEMAILREQPTQNAHKPPMFGVEIEDLVGDEPGVRIATVAGPAAAAGLKPNDVINQLTVNLPIRSRVDFHHAMNKIDVGDRVNFVLMRNNGEKEIVPIIAGGTSRATTRGLENLSYGGSIVDSITRGAAIRDDVSNVSSTGSRGYLRRGTNEKVPELRTYYKPLERPAAGQDRVRHVALDGSISYVPISEIIHNPHTPTSQSPSMAGRSAYVTGPPVVTPGVPRSSSVTDSPAHRLGLMTPDKLEKAPVRLVHTVEQRAFGEMEEDFRCE